MPQHDSVIEQIDNSDSSDRLSTADSSNISGDSLSVNTNKKWHKNAVFHYEYSPFIPLGSNVEKLVVYKAPFVTHFDDTMLLLKVQAITTDSTINQKQDIQTQQEQHDSIAIVKETVPAIRFQVPTNYFPTEKTVNLKTIGIPEGIQQLDSFNTANGLTIPVHFGTNVLEPDKMYFDKNEYIKIESSNYQKINWVERDWLFWPILGILTYFILTRHKHRTFINQTVTSVFYSRMSLRLLKEKNESTSPITQSLLFFYFLTTGLFVFMSMNYYGLYISYTHGFISFLLFSLILAVIYFLKIASIKLLGFIFFQRKVVDEYIHNLKLFNITTGIILLPIVVCIPFLNTYLIGEENLIFSGFGLYSIILLFKLFRGFLISYRQGVSIFYILLYLCTLEILPLALLLRIVTL